MLGDLGKRRFKGCRGVVTYPFPKISFERAFKIPSKSKKLSRDFGVFAVPCAFRGVLHPYNPQPEDRRIWGAQQANPRGLGGQPDWNPLIFDILAAAVIALAPVKRAPGG